MARMHSPNRVSPAMTEGMEPGTKCKRLPCPKCGERYGDLPNHVTSCDGGDDE